MDSPATALLALCDRDLRDRILQVLDREGISTVGVAEDAVEAVQIAIAYRPRLVVVDSAPAMAWTQLCTYIALAAPWSWLVLLADAREEPLLQTAMLLGVRQVISHSEAAVAIPKVMAKLQGLDDARLSEEFKRATDPQRCARIIAISGAKGGVGKTTLAANLGEALASLNVGPVLVWDGYCQFGDVASIMAVPSVRTLADFAEIGDEIDEDMVLSCIVKRGSGADVLLTSDRPCAFDLLTEGFVDSVVRALRTRYRFIVVDTAPILHPLSNVVFFRCWRLLIVTTLKDVTSITDGMKLLQMLEPRYVRSDAIRFVSNRVARSDSVREKEVESLTQKPLAISIPEDPSIGQANNLGTSILQVSPKGPAARAIALLALQLVESASSFASSSSPPPAY